MSNPVDAYSYQHRRAEADSLRLRNTSTQLRRRSLRFSLVPGQQDQTPQGKRAKNTFSDEAYTLPTLSLTPSDQTDQSLDHSDDSILESPLKNRHSRHRKDPVTPKRPSAHSVTRQVGSPLKQTHTKAKGNAQKTQDPSQSSIRTHLQGFGPHTSRQVNETDMDHRVSSLVQDGPPKQHKGASIWWKYVYPLESPDQPLSYSLDNIPLLTKKPNVRNGVLWVGCRLCNAPTYPNTRSEYV